jgi:sugar-specific transcriptional regulator TrmB
MTTMEIEHLTRLGFNKNEAIVFLTLLKLGGSDANQIIKTTKFHKNIVYDNLEKLIDKGLVTFIKEKGKKVFSPESSNILKEHFTEKEKEFNTKRELAKEISKEIVKFEQLSPQKQVASISRGVKAIKSFYLNDALKEEEYFILGAPKEGIEIMGDYFWANHRKKREEKGIKVKMVFNSSIRFHGDTADTKYNKIRYFEKDFEPLTETHIQKGIVAIIVWADEPLLFKIKNKQVADSYKKYFDKIWKQAKR